MTKDLTPSDPLEPLETVVSEADAVSVPDTAPDDDLHFTDLHIREIQDALEAEDLETVGALLADLAEADIAELLMKIEAEERTQLVACFGREFPPETYLYMDAELRAEVLERMGSRDAAQIVSELDSDDALDLLVDLDPVFQKDIILKLSAKDRAAVEEGLTFPEESAGRLMQREFVTVPQFWTAGKTMDYLRAASDEDMPDEFLDIFVIDPKYHVVGEIPLHRLVRAKRTDTIETLITEDLIKIPAVMDQEEVARIFRRSAISSAPVVDEDGRLLGVITIDDVADVIEEEAAEDILRLGGVGQADLSRDIKETVQLRMPWLLVNLLTALFSSSVVGLFQDEISQIVALAVLMPMVAGMGGNAGTQALTVAVRALATRELSRTNAMRTIKKEVSVGLVNGLVLGCIAGGMTMLRFHDAGLSLVIGLAMITNLVAAAFSGITIPIIISTFKLDPAISSSVWLTAITDSVGFFTFLGLAGLILL